MNQNYSDIKKLTIYEQRELYNRIEKNDLIELLINSNEHIVILSKLVENYKNLYYLNL